MYLQGDETQPFRIHRIASASINDLCRGVLRKIGLLESNDVKLNFSENIVLIVLQLLPASSFTGKVQIPALN